MKNFLTFRQLETECLRMARVSASEIDPALRQVVINNAQYRNYEAREAIDEPFWQETITLTVSADQKFLKDAVTNGGIITAIGSDAIMRNSGLFVAKSLLSITIALKETGAFVAQWLARVTSGGATAVIQTISGTPVTFNSTLHTCYVNVIKTLSTSTTDLSGNYIKSILKISDDQGTGGKERLFDLFTDARAYAEAWDDPNNSKRIVCLHYGETIDFTIGTDATGLGIVQALIKGKPTIFTDATIDNLINSPPESNPVLCDEIAAQFAHLAGKEVPEQVAKRIADHASATE